MVLSNFDELVKAVQGFHKKRVVAIASAEDEAIIEAGLCAYHEDIARPIFIGNAAIIREIMAEKTDRVSDFEIVDAPREKTGQYAVDMVKSGEADILMKGLMESRDFLGPIVKKENGLRTGNIMSHVAFFELPNYHKLLMATDGGMVMYPTLEEKRHIIDNATLALRAMGYECPEHAVVCAIEFVNPKMTETVEAAELARMNEQGIIKNCVVVGPISYDVAMRTDIARHKGYDSPHCGDFDCLIMPNMQAGNILGKSFIVTACAPMAGVIMGAKAPAVMTSRGSSAEEKFNSIAMGALIAFGLGE
ncbi:MAG TPA: phosphate acyltransferase [Eubacteriales bacterium]|jgi:phosphate butyryltransferase|nr:phosphate acyltransferase [Clostridia bacterium]HRV73255.1 phosphate acyltransferase [Eubacteriales bacterium]